MTDFERNFWDAIICVLLVLISIAACFLCYRNGIVHAMRDSRVYIESVCYAPSNYGLAKIIIDIDGQSMIHAAMLPTEREESL